MIAVRRTYTHPEQVCRRNEDDLAKNGKGGSLSKTAPLDILVIGYKSTQDNNEDAIPKDTVFIFPPNHSPCQQSQLAAPPSGGSLHAWLQASSTYNSHGTC